MEFYVAFIKLLQKLHHLLCDLLLQLVEYAESETFVLLVSASSMSDLQIPIKYINSIKASALIKEFSDTMKSGHLPIAHSGERQHFSKSADSVKNSIQMKVLLL